MMNGYQKQYLVFVSFWYNVIVQKKWGMVFLAYFSSKYYVLSLFNWIRIETNFPLVSPFIKFYYVIIYFICWGVYVVNNRK